VIALFSHYPAERTAAWADALRAAIGAPVALAGEAAPETVEIAVVTRPLPGALAGLPKLRLIQSLWAGVEGLLADPTLPAGVPIARLVDPGLATAMAEAVAAHVLALHRQLPRYRAQQAAGLWRQHPQPLARDCPVAILGLGAMGKAAAAMLEGIGFPVLGWHRADGAAGLDRLLAEARIVVNLLPLTAETRHLMDAGFFARLRPGAAVINFGRGGHLVVPDLIAALDSGRVGHAVLDVFESEPLAPDSALWRHPGVTLTPHVAAETGLLSAAACVAANIAAFRAGRPLTGLVDRTRGY